MGTLKDQYAIVAAINGEKALKMAATDPRPDIILLDIMMPGMDGFEVCSRLKADAGTCDIPVIFLSALDDTANKVKGFATGAVDYIAKPFQPEEVHVRVNTHLTMSRLKQSLAEKNDELRAYSERLEERVRERTGRTGLAQQCLRALRSQRIHRFAAKEEHPRNQFGRSGEPEDDRHVCGYSGMDDPAGKDDAGAGF